MTSKIYPAFSCTHIIVGVGVDVIVVVVVVVVVVLETASRSPRYFRAISRQLTRLRDHTWAPSGTWYRFRGITSSARNSFRDGRFSCRFLRPTRIRRQHEKRNYRRLANLHFCHNVCCDSCRKVHLTDIRNCSRVSVKILSYSHCNLFRMVCMIQEFASQYSFRIGIVRMMSLRFIASQEHLGIPDRDDASSNIDSSRDNSSRMPQLDLVRFVITVLFACIRWIQAETVCLRLFNIELSRYITHESRSPNA